MKTIYENIESLVVSLCKHVCYDKVGTYHVAGRVAEGVFESAGNIRNFRILLTIQKDSFGAVMATVEYGIAERSYRLDDNGTWETL